MRAQTPFLLLSGLCAAPAVSAQLPAQDVPKSHWAYEAVQSLAAKGMIHGYPPDSDFFGARAVTRYEMASIVARVVRRAEELLAEKAGLEARAREDLKRLLDEYKIELTVIGADLRRVKAELDAARKTAEGAAADAAAARRDIGELRAETQANRKSLEKQQAEFQTYREYLDSRRLTGYIQARYDALFGDSSLFVPAGAGGTGQRPTLGGPRVGGPSASFLARRTRLRFGGRVSPLADWVVQLDAPSTGSLNMRDAYLNLSDFPVKNFALRIGQFTPPVTFELPFSSRLRESPERSLAFSESTLASQVFKTTVSSTGGVVTPGSVLPLFSGQDRDQGAMFSWNFPNVRNPRTRLMFGFFDGEGRDENGVRNLDGRVDLAGRAETFTPLGPGALYAGISGYYGSTAVRSAPPAANGTLAPFRNAVRFLGGVDLRYVTKRGQEIRGEFIGGKFEATPDRALYLRGNRVYGFYVVGKQPLSSRLALVAKYEEYHPIATDSRIVAGLTGAELARKALHGGLLYRLDTATTLRLWYTQGLTPFDPSAPAGPRRGRLGLLSADVQIEY